MDSQQAVNKIQEQRTASAVMESAPEIANFQKGRRTSKLKFSLSNLGHVSRKFFF